VTAIQGGVVKAARLVSPDLVERFREDGYVVVPDLLVEDELANFADAVRRAVAERQRHEHRALHEKSAYEQSFIQCMNLWEDFPQVRPLTFHASIGQAAAELLGATAIRLWHDQALFKEAGGRKTDAHQDLAYWTMDAPDALTAWIPFAGTTHASGCMGYIPGSHRAGVRRFVNIFRAGSEDLDAQARDLMTGDFVYVEVPRGSIAFHHGLTMHDARPNVSGVTREVHTMIYFRDGVRRSATGAHFAVDRAGIAPGEPIASAVTPIAWPLQDGVLPDAPPPIAELPLKWQRSGAYPRNPPDKN
jgi:ectoine hydroxylase-related dioxygenase (phytanoyl-CoA dioxygenase family)